MQVFRHFPKTSYAQPMALSIGNFDGIHLGHQALLRKLKQKAVGSDLKAAVMTFEPHPRELFTPNRAPARLTSLREKLEHFADAGIDEVYVCHFTRHFAGMSADDFMQRILKEALNAQAILVGEDFRFGAGRTGGLVELGAAGFELISLPEIKLGGLRISSTRVREALHEEDLMLARDMLGRWYSISGKVVYGRQLGRQLGFPTANIHMRHERPALTGVYAVKFDGLPGVANLGVRPTIAGTARLTLEVHLLDFAGDLYGRHVHVSFLKKLRDEMKFPNLDALKQQIELDSSNARKVLKNFHHLDFKS